MSGGGDGAIIDFSDPEVGARLGAQIHAEAMGLDADAWEASRAGGPAAETVVPLPIIRISDVADPGPVCWLILGLWVCGAFGIVGAEPKSYKSMLTAWLALHVALGLRVFDRAVSKGRVLMLSVEGGAALLKQRLARMAKACGASLADADLYAIDVASLHLDDPAELARLVATVRDFKPALLVLDPLRDLHGGDEDDAGDMARLIDPLRVLTVETGAAVMLVHHMGKAGEATKQRRPGQRLRGSSALHGAVDCALYLSPMGEGPHKVVTVTAEHRAAPSPEPFTLALKEAGDAMWLQPVEEEDMERKDEEAVLAAVDAAKGPMVKRELRLASKINVRRADAAIARLLAKGELVSRDDVTSGASGRKHVREVLVRPARD